MGQKQRVYNYIKLYGSISPLEAFRDLGITKLATVISSMKRHDGIIFYQRFESSFNRFKEKVYYMRYWLSKEKFEEELGKVRDIL